MTQLVGFKGFAIPQTLRALNNEWLESSKTEIKNSRISIKAHSSTIYIFIGLKATVTRSQMLGFVPDLGSWWYDSFGLRHLLTMRPCKLFVSCKRHLNQPPLNRDMSA